MKRPVYFMAGIYEASGQYNLYFERLTGDEPPSRDRAKAVQTLMQGYASALERQCRHSPYNWFNFYDFWESHANTLA